MAPVLTIIAGPNGSGKTTLTRALQDQGIEFGAYINPDDIARTLAGDAETRSRQAQTIADQMRDQSLAAGRDFAFETVMSHRSKIELLQRARDLGYDIVLYFVGLEDPRLNVARVRQRVAAGGHAVPEDRIVARYERTMALLPEAYALATEAAIFDNSGLVTDPNGGLRLVVHKRAGDPNVAIQPPVPTWVWERLLRSTTAPATTEARPRAPEPPPPETGFVEAVAVREPDATGPELRLVRRVYVDRSRDALLDEAARTLLQDQVLLPGESYQDSFARVATALADDADHAQRLYDYISHLWLVPSPQVLTAGSRSLTVADYLNAVGDSFEDVQSTWAENAAFAANGGTVSTFWGGVRAAGETVASGGLAGGVIPFIRVMEALTLAVNRGPGSEAAAAVWLDIGHPEIEEFLEIRRTAGNPNRRAPNLDHGVAITDAFMEAVRNSRAFDLRSPKSGEIAGQVDARALWARILEVRLATGQPHLLFVDNANRALPQHQRDLGLAVRQAGSSGEIVLPTGKGHQGLARTAVGCVSALNLDCFLEWRDHLTFIEDVLRFLDNALEDFIIRAPREMRHAVYAARRERSLGLGVVGFHSFLMGQGAPFESAAAKSWNARIFKLLRRGCDQASRKLAAERGPCPDAAERGVMQRFSHRTAIGAAAGEAILVAASPGVAPITGNCVERKGRGGPVMVRNRHLAARLREMGQDTDAVWNDILAHGGSVQHLEGLDAGDKVLFRTALEIDPNWVVQLAADRQPDICQAQAIELWAAPDIDKWDLHLLHWGAWERGCKTLARLRVRTTPWR